VFVSQTVGPLGDTRAGHMGRGEVCIRCLAIEAVMNFDDWRSEWSKGRFEKAHRMAGTVIPRNRCTQSSDAGWVMLVEDGLCDGVSCCLREIRNDVNE
jgi:hypothetical protein